MYKIIFPVIILILVSCTQQAKSDRNKELNDFATQYVRLGLAIGQYDADFVDAYYGPDSLRPGLKPANIFPKDSLLNAVNNLIHSLDIFDSLKNDTLKSRALWIQLQLKAFERRIKLFSGDPTSFDEESKELYGAIAPTYNEDHFKTLVQTFDSLLPGKGSINERYQQLASRFIIPTDKLDTVLKTSIAECRKRTMQHFTLPASESFRLEYVNNKPWSGYNWYKGNYKSVIQINTDLKIYINRAIDIGSHESYPGHHVYNMLLEKNLYRDKGWVEISLYPLYSPQSFIAEGTANYGISAIFPADEKVQFAKDVLLPLAGLDTTGISLYFKAIAFKDQLNYISNEVGRGLLDKTLNKQQAIKWLKDYGLMNNETAEKSISFIRDKRSYIINYNYGKDLIKQYIASQSGESTAKQWELFGWLLSNEVTPAGLAK
jgi:hypothetical protein